MNKGLLWSLLACLLVTIVAAQEDGSKGKRGGKGKGKGKDGEEEADGHNDFEVYEVLSSMRQLTPHENFYDLLGLGPSATDSEIGRAFRKLSTKYHPDKQGPQHTKMFNLIQYAGALLRDAKRRARYEWLMHEAPAWHRESVYARQRTSRSPKISIKQALLFPVLLAILGQFAMQWINFCVQWSRIQVAKKEMAGMGEKEVKRIRKKLADGDAAFLSGNKADYETVLLADSGRPALPTPLDLFVLAAPLALVRRAMGRQPARKSD